MQYSKKYDIMLWIEVKKLSQEKHTDKVQMLHYCPLCMYL